MSTTMAHEPTHVIDAGGYRVTIGAGLRREFGALVASAAPAHHYAVVSDDAVAPHYAEALVALLARHGLSENILRAVVEKQEQVQLRKPQLALTPVAPAGTGGADSVEVAPGEVLLMAPAPSGRRSKSEPDRWYKVSMR